MYSKILDSQRMTDVEASELYPDSYIIMSMDDMFGQVGTVLYVGDDEDEIYSLLMTLQEPFCGVIEGLNHRRNCLGGVVICG